MHPWFFVSYDLLVFCTSYVRIRLVKQRKKGKGKKRKGGGGVNDGVAVKKKRLLK